MRQFALFAALCLLSLAGSAASPFDGAPAAPPGYATVQEVHDALLKGEVAMIKAPDTPPDSVAITKDLVYASPDGQDLKLDLFEPKDAKQARPLLLFIHGGGWKKGKKEDYIYYNLKFAELGYVTASMQYRLAPDHHFPKALQDVRCALAYLRTHAAEHHIDATKIAVLGGSAGGHLSLMAGYATDPALSCPGAAPEVSGPVQAVVNFYGVVDCTPEYAREAGEVTGFLGTTWAENPEIFKQASPIFHLAKGAPPTLTFHGTIDELVPIEQADQLHKKLDELGVPNYCDRVEGWPHTMDLAVPVNARCCYVIEKFLAMHLPLPK
ncbi:MAG: alpha/beta hydrolase [Candidatus Hydrogenedentes bacterium]|nr:alpha/beta hydrolase [Candidatus Hydrogenedentota bacterium]